MIKSYETLRIHLECLKLFFTLQATVPPLPPTPSFEN